MNNGVLYIAFVRNKKANRMKELEYSIRSLKRIHPKLSTTLFTDKAPKISGFDNVVELDIESERVKQDLLYRSPYDNTLYIDCDTGIVGPIEESFGLMERFDVAATHDLMRKDENKSRVYPDYAAITDGFPEYAGGVIMFKKSPRVENFFDTWRKNYKIWLDLTGEVRDQPSFRVSLWQCKDLHIHTLPSEFNIRTKKYNNIVPRINHWHDMWRK